jgi:hypothetical protein
MGAFQSGFQMGQSAWQQALDNKAREERDRREAEAHAQRMSEGGLRLKGLQRADNQAEQEYGLRQDWLSASQGVDRRATNAALDADFDQADALARQGAALPVAAPNVEREAGLTRRIAAADIPNRERAIAGQLAAVRGDYASTTAIRKDQKDADWQTGFAAKMKEFDSMKDEDRGALVQRLSYDNGVPGFGTWTPGKGKMAGYLTYLPPSGDPVKLNSREAAQLYALGQMMEVDPERALAAQEKVSDRVRAVAGQLFTAQTQGATGNNTAVHYANQDAAARERNSIALGAAKRADARAEAAEWKLIGTSKDGSKLLRYNERTGQMAEAAPPPGVSAVEVFRRVSGAQPTKPMPELSPRETEAHKSYLRALDNTPGLAPAQRASLAKYYGLDPAKIGVVDPVAQYAELLKDGPADAKAAPAAAPAQAAPLPARVTPNDRLRGFYMPQQAPAPMSLEEALPYLNR